MSVRSNGRAIGYCRVSTQEQATEGVSLEVQQAAITAYIAMRGFHLIEVVVDPGVSAGKTLADREGGRRVLEQVRGQRVAHVVTFKLDRLFRDCADCLTVTRLWDKRCVALHLVDLGGQTLDTSSAMGRFFLTVMAGAAELERNLIGERTSAAMRHMRSQNRYTGGHAPYGWRLTEAGALARVPSEQKVLVVARALRAEGLSLRAVGRELADRGLRPRTGGVWHGSQIRNLVKDAA